VTYRWAPIAGRSPRCRRGFPSNCSMESFDSPQDTA
jgi:hypothetical protein